MSYELDELMAQSSKDKRIADLFTKEAITEICLHSPKYISQKQRDEKY